MISTTERFNLAIRLDASEPLPARFRQRGRSGVLLPMNLPHGHVLELIRERRRIVPVVNVSYHRHVRLVDLGAVRAKDDANGKGVPRHVVADVQAVVVGIVVRHHPRLVISEVAHRVRHVLQVVHPHYRVDVLRHDAQFGLGALYRDQRKDHVPGLVVGRVYVGVHQALVAVGHAHVRRVEAGHVVVPEPFADAPDGDVEPGVAERPQQILPRQLVPRGHEVHVEPVLVGFVSMREELEEPLLLGGGVHQRSRSVHVEPVALQAISLLLRQQASVQLDHAPSLGVLQEAIREALLQSHHVGVLRSHRLAVVCPRHRHDRARLQRLVLQILNLGDLVLIADMEPVLGIETVGHADGVAKVSRPSVGIPAFEFRPRI
mmetsp:Transcript_2595/g.5526  ORF Transcript_2595/g.5526 Transcript_2595/m.5526 type:complete len:375 (+) Transcript_2595:96-1220(+)